SRTRTSGLAGSEAVNLFPTNLIIHKYVEGGIPKAKFLSFVYFKHFWTIAEDGPEFFLVGSFFDLKCLAATFDKKVGLIFLAGKRRITKSQPGGLYRPRILKYLYHTIESRVQELKQSIPRLFSRK